MFLVSRVRGVGVRVGALGKRGFAVGCEYYAECVRQYGTGSGPVIRGSIHPFKGDGVLLKEALFNFGTIFLDKRGYQLIQTCPFVRKEIMEKCAPLVDLSKHAFATPEQQLCCIHYGDILDPNTLPIRYGGYSYRCRKDGFGIPELWQFCITSPNGNESWDMQEEMIRTSEDFYKELNIPYRVVPTVSGALNLATGKKYSLEAWFPASKRYIKLVSCCNYTDYMSRALGIRYGEKKSNEQSEQYVHLLCCTITGTEMTIRCIVENYQREDGVEIPEALRPYLLGIDFSR